ncbi:hypothetical protein BDF14DRAFT_1720146, partial [Spinellus fusiger]
LGEAVGFMRDCKADLRAIHHHAGLSKARRSALAIRAQKEEETVAEWLHKLTKINDTVAYQTVPSRQGLQQKIPSGRSILEMKHYTPPLPLFGPAQEEVASSERAKYARDGSYW